MLTTRRVTLLFAALVGIYFFTRFWKGAIPAYRPEIRWTRVGPPPSNLFHPPSFQELLNEETGGNDKDPFRPYPQELLEQISKHNEIFHPSPASSPTTASALPTPSNAPPCTGLEGLSNVLIVLKTGATEIYDKLPTHYLTTFTCTSHFLIFSDLEQDIGPWHVYDALADVSSDVKASHDDFELWRKQKTYITQHQDPGAVTGETKKNFGKKAWDLDKWKNLPMAIQAKKLKPGYDWYFFIDADTYASLTNLVHWLKKLNPNELIYAGCQVQIGDTIFGHGGSGYILSKAALQKLDEKIGEPESEGRRKWEDRTKHVCCGDQLIAEALLEETGTPLLRSFPLIQGETPSTLDWTKWHWCRPAVTWHHMSGGQMDEMWRVEQEWIKEQGPEEPIVFSALFEKLIVPHLTPGREKWDNLAEQMTYNKDTAEIVLPELDGRKPYDSLESCQDACQAQNECLQYLFTDPDLDSRACTISNVVKLGSPDETGQKRSGWMIERIHKFMEESNKCPGLDDKGLWITN